MRYQSFIGLFIIATFVANGLAFILAYLDRSWGALFVGVVANPTMNLIFLATGIGLGFHFKRKEEAFQWKRHLLITIGFPLLACGTLFGSILALDLHGC